MNKLTLFIFLLFISLSINAQTKTVDEIKKQNESFGRMSRCRITYDKFKDMTFVLSEPMSASAYFKIQGGFSFEGQTLEKPIKNYSIFITTGKFLDDSSLIFIADNERVEIGKAISENSPGSGYMGMRGYTQQYIFTSEQFEKFISSKDVEFQISNGQSKLGKNVAERLNVLMTLSSLK